MYKVVGWRKEYYQRCIREMDERQERLKDFLWEEFGIEKEDVVRCNSFFPVATIKNAQKYEFNLRRRKDIRFQPYYFAYLVFNKFGIEHNYEATVKPDKKTRVGKELAKRWKEALNT